VVHAVETNLQKLLEGTKQYRIPLYQRTYSWRHDQLSRLWDDLVTLTDDRRVRGQAATHFIGSLVLAPSPDIGPTGVQEFLVVDGQQRLTTVTVLLAAIRDHRAETENPAHLDRINEKYLINKWEDGQPPKVLPTQADRSSYLACINRTPHAGGPDPVGAAYRYFRARLVDVDDPDDELDIARLEDAVIGGLSLVSVTAQAGDNVHRIFESLNNTGLRLTQGDLIRNYLFMRLPVRGEYVYRTRWLPLQERLDSNQLELLFWLDLVQHDDSAKQTDTYALQQARLDRLDSEAAIETEVARFADLGELLAVILTPAMEPDSSVRLQLERLNAWGTTTVYPVLLHLLDQRKRGEANTEEVVVAMRYLESFFVRRVVIGQATKNLNRILLRAVQDIRGQTPLDGALRDYLSTGRKSFATDAEVRAAVRTVPFYWSGRNNQKKLVLSWIEETYGSKEPVAPDRLTIEHVLPQTLTDEWRAALLPELAAGEDIDTVHQSVVHTLGNLTLTGYNSELSNRSFESKRGRLRSSGLMMNQEIADCVSWNRAAIAARADELAGRIARTWPGPNPATATSETNALWTALAKVLAEIPAGSWTTYGDLAAVIGTHPVPLGQRLAKHPAPNAHRVLTVDGFVAPNFRWLDSDRTDDPRAVLEAEGIDFNEEGRADPARRLAAEDLAVLTGLDTGAVGPEDQDSTSLDDRAERFLSQVTEFQSAETLAGLTIMLDAWTDLGGDVGFGASEETSCFLMPGIGARPAWPFTIYPSGKVEVVFQHMASRPPFDDVTVREAFRRQLDVIPGIELPASKLELRPGFPLENLSHPDRRDAIIAALAWFIATARSSTAQTDMANE
jgi:alkylated DNA nucleotide flippase Atl1